MRVLSKQEVSQILILIVLSSSLAVGIPLTDIVD